MGAEQRPNGAATDIPKDLTDLDRDHLSRMVREVNDGGVSFQAMADRAERAGHKVSKGYFQKLAANVTVKTPDPDQLRTIAAGLDRPYRAVQRAAATQFLHYEAVELSGYGDDVGIIVAHLAGMSDQEQRRWRLMIEADERARRGE